MILNALSVMLNTALQLNLSSIHRPTCQTTKYLQADKPRELDPNNRFEIFHSHPPTTIHPISLNYAFASHSVPSKFMELQEL